MTRIFLLAPLALAACIPCDPTCAVPSECVCTVTVSDTPRDGKRMTPPQRDNGPDVIDHGPGNGGGTKDDGGNGGDSGSSDENGDWS